MHPRCYPEILTTGRHVERGLGEEKGKRKKKSESKMPILGPSDPFPLLVMNESSLMNDDDDDEMPVGGQ